MGQNCLLNLANCSLCKGCGASVLTQGGDAWRAIRWGQQPLWGTAMSVSVIDRWVGEARKPCVLRACSLVVVVLGKDVQCCLVWRPCVGVAVLWWWWCCHVYVGVNGNVVMFILIVEVMAFVIEVVMVVCFLLCFLLVVVILTASWTSREANCNDMLFRFIQHLFHISYISYWIFYLFSSTRDRFPRDTSTHAA